jgi:hypothetical protein
MVRVKLELPSSRNLMPGPQCYRSNLITVYTVEWAQMIDLGKLFDYTLATLRFAL